MNKLIKDSKRLSYFLRHHPEEAGCTIDKYGWVDIDTLCKNTNFTKEYLREIVDSDTRYTFSEDGKKIRAFHGHSVDGIIYTNEVEPPNILYHGTSKDLYEKIKESGYIKGMSRVLVHLSDTKEKAKVIGERHGDPVLLQIDCSSMIDDGFKFYKSEDGVYLCEDIPLKYILKI